jgi:hypothetical protein
MVLKLLYGIEWDENGELERAGQGSGDGLSQGNVPAFALWYVLRGTTSVLFEYWVSNINMRPFGCVGLWAVVLLLLLYCIILRSVYCCYGIRAC